jgi:hypothetical protein
MRRQHTNCMILATSPETAVPLDSCFDPTGAALQNPFGLSVSIRVHLCLKGFPIRDRVIYSLLIPVTREARLKQYNLNQALSSTVHFFSCILQGNTGGTGQVPPSLKETETHGCPLSLPDTLCISHHS